MLGTIPPYQSAYQNGDTIVALATAPLPAGVAVIRLSGPAALPALAALGVAFHTLKPRHATLRPLFANQEKLDHALLLHFPAPHSFTGEDVVELHTHGSPAVIQQVLHLLTRHPAVRHALPGEFTRRAVHHGKMDLTQAEGLADLIAATTSAQQRQATRQLDGALGRAFENWRIQLLELLAQTEAAIDFPDEELSLLNAAAFTGKVQHLLDQFTQALSQHLGQQVREGLRLAIIGQPNAGKSSLLNLLAGADVAIVSPLAGTTRDVVTHAWEIAGYPVTLADTAGLRATTDTIEHEGIRRAEQQAAAADLLLAVADAHDFLPHLPPSTRGAGDGGTSPAHQANPSLAPDETVGARRAALAPAVAGKLLPGRSLIILSKPDLLPAESDFTPPPHLDVAGEKYPILATNLTEEKSALKRLLPALEHLVKSQAATATEAALLTRARHRTAVEAAAGALGRALILLHRPNQSQGTVAELIAQDLRDAAHALGTVTGRTGSEDVLDLVFSTFCIGK